MDAIKGKRVAVCGPSWATPKEEIGPDGFLRPAHDLFVAFHNHPSVGGPHIRYVFYQGQYKRDIPPVALFLDESVSAQADSRYHALRALPQAHGYHFARGGRLPEEPEQNRHHVAVVDGEPTLAFQFLPLTGVFAIAHLLHLGAAEVYATGMDFYGGNLEWVGGHWIPPQIEYLKRLLKEEPRFSCDYRLRAILEGE